MPAIIAKSISILSDAGLGMAMFSLGKYFYFFSHKNSLSCTHTYTDRHTIASTCIYDDDHHHHIHVLSNFKFSRY